MKFATLLVCLLAATVALSAKPAWAHSRSSETKAAAATPDPAGPLVVSKDCACAACPSAACAAGSTCPCGPSQAPRTTPSTAPPRKAAVRRPTRVGRGWAFRRWGQRR